MGRDKLAEVSCVFIGLSFTALFGASLCQTFTLHPRNVTTLYDRTVVFTCDYTTTTFQPQWLIVAEGTFGSTQTLSFPASQGLYSYHTATPTQAQVSVRALRDTPGLNNTCFSCRFINFGLVESGRGCLIIASPPLKPFVRVSEIRFNHISLEWEAPWSAYPIKNYTLELQNSEGVHLSTTLLPKELLTYRVTGLVGATQYRFRLRANSDAGYGTWSDAISEETASSSTQTLSVEVIGIIVGCILAVVAIVIAVIVVISIVYCW